MASSSPPILPCDDPADRMEETLLSIVPDSARRAYDMKKVVAAIVDRGRFFEIKPGWAKTLNLPRACGWRA